MELYAKNRYQQDGFFSPDDDINPKERDAAWFKRKCESVYSLYCSDRTGITSTRAQDFAINRLYARGMQPNTKYMDILCPKDKKSGKRKMWMNISWDILPIFPKFRSVVLGMFEKLDFKIVLNAIDEKSSDEKELMKFKLWVEKKEQDYLSQFDQMAGTDSEVQEQPYMPESLEELEMMAEMGAFKLMQEVAMEQCVKLAMYNSNWDQIKRQMIEDFIDLGVAVCKDYVDPITQKVMSRYVDPENFVVRWGRNNDFNDITEAGELVLYSINQVREQIPGVDEQLLKGAALQYNGLYGNPGTRIGYQAYYNSRDYYEHNKVLVLDCEFLGIDKKVYQTRNINGNDRVFEEDYSFKKKSNDKRKVDRIDLQQWFRCKWIVGTDIVFDYGYQHDVPRPRKNKPVSSYHVYRVADRSMVESCIVAIDNIQLNHLKLQNDYAKAPPAGLKVEWGALSNMAVGGEKLHPLEVLAIYRQTGDLLHRAQTVNGSPIQGSNSPVEEMEGGMGRILDERIKIFEFNFNMIRDITGVNQIADASAPQSGALNGTSQMALNATMNVLTPILYAYKHMKEQTARNMCLRSQIVLMNKDIEGEMAMSQGFMQVVKVSAKDGLDLAEFGITVEAAANDEQKAIILNAANTSMQAGKNGAPGIKMRDFLFIKRMLDQDQIRYAEFVLAAREEQEFKKQQQLNAENSQTQAKVAQEAEQLKQQGQQAAFKMKAQYESMMESAKTQAAILIDDHKTANLIKLKEAEAKIEIEYFGKPTETKAIESVG